MKITSHQIETWAVNKVDEVFTRSPRITSSISRGDKEPVWDGAIYLTSSDKSLTQRIPIQVKGKTRKTLPLKPSYSISVTNLRSYLRDGGILYCVVFIIGDERFFYYAKLAPIDLKRYIKSANGQASISVQLKPYDKSVPEMELELESFINDCKKQTSYVNSPILTINDAFKCGYNINFQASGIQPFKEPVYLYAEIQTGDTTFYHPIGDQAYNVTAGIPVNNDVSVKGRSYYDSFFTFNHEDEVTFIVSNVFRAKFKKTENELIPISTQFESRSKKLSERIHELSFINDVFSINELRLGEQIIKFKKVSKKNIDEAKKALLYCQKVRLLFDKLHIFEDIIIGEFTQDDINNLSLLIEVILDGKTLKFNNDIDIISHIDIFKYRICLIAEKHDDGTYSLYDFFESEDKLCFAYEDEKGRKLMTSMFSIAFWLNDFTKFSNVDYSKLIPSYEAAILHNPSIIGRANNDMLMAIKAYDLKEPKDSDLYDAITALSNWIIGKSEENSPIHIINKYQIIKRRRKLEKSEKIELNNLLYSHNITPDVEAAIHLLLDNETQFEISFDKMTNEEKDFFNSLPISLFKK